MRSRLLTAVLAVPLAAALVVAAPARGSSPSEGTVDTSTPAVQWTGSTLAQTGGLQGGGCVQAPVPDPTCDTFTLTIGELAAPTVTSGRKKPKRSAPPPADDVLVGLAPVTAGIAEFDLYVYDAAGAEVARAVELGSNDTVVLREPAPGTYTVAVQNVLSADPQASYAGRAQVVDAGPVVPVDPESACGFEGAPERDTILALDAPIGSSALVGDPTAVADGLDTGQRVVLDVLVLLDGVPQARAEEIFDPQSGAPRSYEPLNVELRAVEYRPVTFLPATVPGHDDAAGLIQQAKDLLGGERPAGVDIVEVLTSRDIQQLGQTAVAGLADCIGGVAHPDRAFAVAEAFTPSDYAIGPAVFGVEANPNVTAHEIGHLMGGHHHYGNCVESVASDDVRDDGTVEGSPCTLMFNAADFLGPQFGSLNAAVVRGHAVRWAQP